MLTLLELQVLLHAIIDRICATCGETDPGLRLHFLAAPSASRPELLPGMLQDMSSYVMFIDASRLWHAYLCMLDCFSLAWHLEVQHTRWERLHLSRTTDSTAEEAAGLPSCCSACCFHFAYFTLIVLIFAVAAPSRV